MKNLESHKQDSSQLPEQRAFSNAYKNIIREMQNPNGNETAKKGKQSAAAVEEEDLKIPPAVDEVLKLLLTDVKGKYPRPGADIKLAFDKDDINGKPALMVKESDMCNKIRETLQWKRMVKECMKALGGDGCGYHLQAVRPPATAQKFEANLKGSLLEAGLFAGKVELMEKKVSEKVFGLQAWAASSKWFYIGCSPYGLGECRVILGGKLAIALIHLEDCPGETPIAKKDGLQKMAKGDLDKLLIKSGVCFACSVNDVVVIPAGFMSLMVACTSLAACGLRWTFLSGNTASKKASKAIVDDMLNVYPKLQGTLYPVVAEWLSH